VTERESIFRDFERGEAGRASGAGGGGIGLSIVRSAVERHGGTILVEDAPGGGARFIVQVPA
jgi:signal transduction histidine kinase